MSQSFDNFKELYEDFLDNYEKFLDKGNKAAGTRARKSLLEMSKMAKELRAEIQEAKNAN